MCAINGFNFSDVRLIRAMNDAARHRGPDGDGEFLHDRMTLGHNRLSIIDLSPAGAQPMKSADEKRTIVFSGEIYNYRELKGELRGTYPFRTESDTEVILAAYEKWGEECLARFNGIFAFAVWDTEKNELFLARDRVGVKPLYYFWDGTRFIFSSEIKAILCHDIPRLADRAAANLYFQVLYVPAPHTMFEGVRKVLPAHFLRLKDGRLEDKEYWRPDDFENFKSRGEAKERIRELFHDSVRHQLIS
ncbi:MAG: asparagine synthetase B, partial [Candidatus Niyogibacteria bacterium]|nr:asparagine synthetase B [Candidatus Niyogibacteria bacterium]